MYALFNCIALGPLAVYLLLLGIVNLSRRPLIVSSGRDIAALAVALVGFVLIGPLALLLPMAAAGRFGIWTWVLLLALYLLVVTMIVLMGRPRLVIYNITVDRLRPILAELASQLDSQARWAGETLLLPQMGVHLHVETFPLMRNVSLVAIKAEQPLEGWQRLERALSAELREVEVARNPRGGLIFVALAIMFGSGIAFSLTDDPAAFAQALKDFFQL